MSLFDPQHVYYHTVRSTRKGQVLQQKPIHHQGAYDSDEIPRALGLLKTYGYHVYPPNYSLTTDRTLFLPFSYTITQQSLDNIDLDSDSLISYLKTIPDLQTFITANPTSIESQVFIGLTSVMVRSQNNTDGNQSFVINIYDKDANLNVSQSFNLTSQSSITSNC